jgi:putative transposase
MRLMMTISLQSEKHVTLTGSGRSVGDQQTHDTKPPLNSNYRHRFLAEIISHGVWLYLAVSLIYRDVELLLPEQGIIVSFETVRRWCQKFAHSFANRLPRRRPRAGDKLYIDKVFVRPRGVQHYLWRALNQNGIVVDIPAQPRWAAKADKRFFRRVLDDLQYVLPVTATDKPNSSGATRRR